MYSNQFLAQVIFCHYFERSWWGLFQNASCPLCLISTFLLVGIIYGRPSIKIAIFRPYPLTNMATISNSYFWMVDFWKSSPLKPVDHINRNFTGIIYGRSSIGLPNFISLGQKHGRHGQLLFIEWIVLRVFDSMSKDLLYLLPFPWITWLKEAEKCQFPKFESFYFLSILMQFLQSLYLNGVLMSHYKKCYWDLCKII